MGETAEAVTGLSLGFAWFQTVCPAHTFSLGKRFPALAGHMDSIKRRVEKRTPTLKTKRITILPVLQLEVKNRKIWIHHWMWLSVLFGLLSYNTQTFGQLLFLKSVCASGVLQGLLYKDRFKIIVRANKA